MGSGEHISPLLTHSFAEDSHTPNGSIQRSTGREGTATTAFIADRDRTRAPQNRIAKLG